MKLTKFYCSIAGNNRKGDAFGRPYTVFDEPTFA